MAMVLIALLAVGPFLHAHFGASTVTGLHVAGIQAILMADGTQTAWSQPNEPESAALGVETSYARQLTLDVQDPPQVGAILAVFVLAVVAFFLPFARQRTQRNRRPGRNCFLPGLPALTHAPPL